MSERIADNARSFDELLEGVLKRIATRKLAEAAAYAQVAADFAWNNHPGFFASPRLEAAVRTIAEGVPVLHSREMEGGKPRTGRRVLHVLTQAYATGGHTQLAANWIHLDDRNTHAVVVTGQGASTLPRVLVEAAADSYSLLDGNGGDLLVRASALRALAASSDLVVLHHHPSDVVPVLAFSDPASGTPVVTSNHADHVHWVGTSISHVVANIRDSGQRLSIERRGIEAARSTILPIPLRALPRLRSRSEAKRRLGLPSSAFLLLTAAAEYKYGSPNPSSFLDLVEPWLALHPQAMLVAVGPTSRGRWRQAEERSSGRLRAVGMQTQLTPYYEAADLYLDSYPVSSLTSLLQAGMAGTPLLTFASRPPETAILSADSPGLDPVILRAAASRAYVDALTRVYADSDFRCRLGEETAESIASAHTGPRWREACERVSDLTALLASTPPTPNIVQPSRTALDELVCQTDWGLKGIGGSITRQLWLMPSGARVAAWISLRRNGGKPGARYLLPLRTITLIRRARSRIVRFARETK